jgi:hypothetical protein
MGGKAFSEADMQRRLLAHNSRMNVEAASYHDFFMGQPANISSIYGYGRMLYSDYEVQVAELMLSYGANMNLNMLGANLKLLEGVPDQVRTRSFKPLREAVETISILRTLATEMGSAWLGGEQRANLVSAAHEAATVTARAYRDVALHQLLVLAGGPARASEHALMTGESFITLRKRYQVKLAAGNFELPAWRTGLIQQMRRLSTETNQLAGFRAMQRKLAIIEELANKV